MHAHSCIHAHDTSRSQVEAYWLNTSVWTVALIKMTRRSGRWGSRSRNTMSAMSELRSRSCTSSSTMCVTPASVPPSDRIFSSTPATPPLQHCRHCQRAHTARSSCCCISSAHVRVLHQTVNRMRNQCVTLVAAVEIVAAHSIVLHCVQSFVIPKYSIVVHPGKLRGWGAPVVTNKSAVSLPAALSSRIE